MIIDYRSGEAPRLFEGDVCIVGAGIAGLAIARTFIGSARTVWVIESGGLRSSRRNQSLYEGTSVGVPGIDPAACRLRAFGGACNLWGGGCVPLDSTSHRGWVPHSGWPLAWSTLEPYYRRAGALLGLGPLGFDEAGFLVRPARTPLEFDSLELRNQVCAASPLVPGPDLREVFGSAPNVHVLINANVLELEATADGKAVHRARITTLEQKRGIVHAGHFVLACGGIENARLLLLSSSVVPEGLGNAHGLVGRYFMDHPSGRIGAIASTSPDTLTRPYARPRARGQVAVRPEITLAEAAQRRYRILSARVRPFAVEAAVPGGVGALRNLRARIAARHADEAEAVHRRICQRHNGEPCRSQAGDTRLIPQAVRAALGAGDLFRALARRLDGHTTVPTARIELVGYFEQAPNPDSRILLGDDRDELGQRKVCLDWRLSALDRHTHRTAAMVFGEQLARACNGRFVPDPALLGPAGELRVVGTSHHIGTTRMASQARDGVVDPDCRVHGLDNLYCAGSSVFPTAGWAFPTFAIVALAERLAEHLQKQPARRIAPGPQSKRANELTR